jgi:alkylhydroperoxidase/carboxymuconolactone decarboxylase family protein YurZ
MRYYLGVAKEKGVSEGAIREAMAAVVATNGGRPRAQAREALKGLLDPLPITQATEGCCGHEHVR